MKPVLRSTNDFVLLPTNRTPGTGYVQINCASAISKCVYTKTGTNHPAFLLRVMAIITKKIVRLDDLYALCTNTINFIFFFLVPKIQFIIFI